MPRGLVVRVAALLARRCLPGQSTGSTALLVARSFLYEALYGMLISVQNREKGCGHAGSPVGWAAEADAGDR